MQASVKALEFRGSLINWSNPQGTHIIEKRVCLGSPLILGTGRKNDYPTESLGLRTSMGMAPGFPSLYGLVTPFRVYC